MYNTYFWLKIQYASNIIYAVIQNLFIDFTLALVYKRYQYVYRPYALTSQRVTSPQQRRQSSVAQRARVVLAVRIGTQPLSARARAGQPGGMACRVCPPGCMLGDDARGSVSFDPQRSWAPFCDVICIWSIEMKRPKY